MLRIVSVLFLFFIAACSNDDGNDEKMIEPGIPDKFLVWEANPDSMIMKRIEEIPDSFVTISGIINGLNEKYPEVHIDFLKQGGDTAFTAVPDAGYLGEQMGDAGASAWFADAVINLTTVPGINYVSFQMDLHSHASSGVIGREQYSRWQKR